ncbi:YwmB family TATA-box binding protein [Peribacillus deserti]|nr:YwmB family TATA-box binding protein [Peribacillus deserti]
MSKKYIHILIYAALAGFIYLFSGNTTTIAKNGTDLERIVKVLQSHDEMEIKEWSVFARGIDEETNTTDQYYKKVHDFKKKYAEFDWKQAENDNSLTAAGTRKNKQTGTLETIKIMMTLTKSNPTTYILYETKGTQWTEDNLLYIKWDFLLRTNDIFRENPSIFTCIKGEINDKIGKVLSFYVNEMVDEFLAHEIESIKEENFVSVSAHSTEFNSFLMKDQMNLQLAMRKEGLGGKTTFVVGTPIITFEY